MKGRRVPILRSGANVMPGDVVPGDLGLVLVQFEARSHERQTILGASLAAETDESRDEESRLKAGCSQGWLPHKRPISPFVAT